MWFLQFKCWESTSLTRRPYPSNSSLILLSLDVTLFGYEWHSQNPTKIWNWNVASCLCLHIKMKVLPSQKQMFFYYYFQFTIYFSLDNPPPDQLRNHVLQKYSTHIFLSFFNLNLKSNVCLVICRIQPTATNKEKVSFWRCTLHIFRHHLCISSRITCWWTI
jgi:hypothetical protein